MGWDISGRIECLEAQGREMVWMPSEDLRSLYRGRNYHAFDLLFGCPPGYGYFPSIAEGRGLPADVSHEVREDCEGCNGEEAGMTWVSWAEIKAIDWEEESEQLDRLLHRYERNEKGALMYQGKAAWNREFCELLDGQQRETGSLQRRINELVVKLARAEGPQGEEGNVVYRAERLRRKDVCDDWQDTFDMMRVLARTYGDDAVRLVVWFTF